jgi:threonine dehydratase
MSHATSDSDSKPSDAKAPSFPEIRVAREELGDLVRETPVWQCRSDAVAEMLGDKTQVFLKLELFQFGGSFKPRGALINMFGLSTEELSRGITTVSAGNHAIAAAYAAQVLGTTAKVVMPRSANPARIKRSKEFGAEVILVDDVHKAFDKVRQIEEEEGRTFVHPFEGPLAALGTATLGFELCRQVSDLDAVIVPIGGGGLCAGVSAAVKQMQPRCSVFGVEPEGANTMHLSFASGKPESIDRVRTIADSLGAPHAAPYSFSLCQKYVDELALIDDNAMCRSMALMFHDMKLAVEPAGAAALAALCGPLREQLRGKRVGLIVCGTNIDLGSFTEFLERGESSFS